MGRIVWLLVIERDDDSRFPWWARWLVLGVAAAGLTGFLVYRWVTRGGIF